MILAGRHDFGHAVSLSKKSSRNAGLFHSYPVKWDWVMGMLERGKMVFHGEL
jgi:hypothetical protein